MQTFDGLWKWVQIVDELLPPVIRYRGQNTEYSVLGLVNWSGTWIRAVDGQAVSPVNPNPEFPQLLALLAEKSRDHNSCK